MPIFLHPAFLWAAVASVVPLVLHLLQRRRTVRVPFPTIRFLILAQRRSASRVRFENLLLWLLRTLLLLMLALAFSYPILQAARFGGFFGLGRAPRDIALVLDLSYSMAYEMDRETAWERARNAAIDVVEGLLPGDRVCLFLAGERVEAVFESPTSETSGVIQALRAANWRHQSSDLRDALTEALKALVDSGSRDRELYIFTDGQDLPWETFRIREGSVPDAVGLQPDDFVTYVFMAGAQNPQNVWPAGVALAPPLILDGGDALVSVRIGHSGEARGQSVTLEMNGDEIQRRGLTLGADGETEIEFALTGLQAGTHVMQLRSAPDALPIDDAFHFLLRVRESLPILVVGTRDATRFLSLALRPAAAGRDIRRIDPDALPQEPLVDYDTVFLADALPLTGQGLMALESYVRGGGVLVVFPGNRAVAANYRDWTIWPAMPRAITDVPPRQAARILRRVSREDRLFTGFSLPPGTAPTAAIMRRLSFDPLQPEATTILSAGADEPFLLGRDVGAGRVFLFAVSADRQWSTFPITAFFLPIVQQIVRYGAGLSQPPPALTPARELPISRMAPDHQPGDRILSPTGRDLPIRELRGDSGTRLYLENLEEPGLYTRLRARDGLVEPIAALNVDRAESRLTPVDIDALPAWIGGEPVHVAQDLDGLRRLVDTQRRGRPLAEPLLWIVLALALAEWWLANRTQRRRLKLSESLQVEPSGRVRRRTPRGGTVT